MSKTSIGKQSRISNIPSSPNYNNKKFIKIITKYVGIIGVKDEKIEHNLEHLMLFSKIKAAHMFLHNRGKDCDIIFIDNLVLIVQVLEDQDKTNDGIKEFSVSFHGLKEFLNVGFKKFRGKFLVISVEEARDDLEEFGISLKISGITVKHADVEDLDEVVIHKILDFVDVDGKLKETLDEISGNTGVFMLFSFVEEDGDHPSGLVEHDIFSVMESKSEVLETFGLKFFNKNFY